MTSNHDADRPGEMTDAQLDHLLETANEELLDHVKAATDPSRTLTAIMAGSVPHAPGRRAATPSQVTAVVMIGMRVRAYELGRAIEQPLIRARALAADSRSRGGRHRGALNRPAIWSALGFIMFLTDFFLGNIVYGPAAFVAARLTLVVAGGFAVAFALAVTRRGLYDGRALAAALALGRLLACGLARGFERDVAAYNRALARAHLGGITRARAFPRARDHASARALDRVLARALELHDRADLHYDRDRSDRDRATGIARTLDAIQSPIRAIGNQPVDASGADLSHVRIGDLAVLDGVIWTRQTTWPPGITDKVRRQSDEILDGVYQVRIGNTPDRSGLTHV